MANSSVMIDLDDPRTRKIAEVMSNSTCKKMLSLLAESDLSASELATKLKAPLNTIHYNITKLVGAGLVEPVRSLWSSRGRAVKVYRVSQKKIVISPKSMARGLLPALLVGAVGSVGLRLWWYSKSAVSEGTSKAMAASSDIVSKVSEGAVQSGSYVPAESFNSVLSAAPNAWAWFLIGALASVVALAAWNWFKSWR